MVGRDGCLFNFPVEDVVFDVLCCVYPTLSSLACIRPVCVCALYVKAFSDGFECLHVSWIPHSCLTSLSAVIAFSSVKFRRHSVYCIFRNVEVSYREVGYWGVLGVSRSIFAQNSAWAFLSFGAYTVC